jgi:hypothetical protein
MLLSSWLVWVSLVRNLLRGPQGSLTRGQRAVCSAVELYDPLSLFLSPSRRID